MTVRNLLNRIGDYIIGILAAVIVLLAALLGISHSRLQSILRQQAERERDDQRAAADALKRREQATAQAQHTNQTRRARAESREQRDYFE